MKFRQKIILSLLLAIVLGSVAHPQEVVMPDANLQRDVRRALMLNPNQPITVQQLHRLERLVANNRLLPDSEQISNLTGLEHAVQLEHLVLAGNNISDLTPLQNLVGLRHLALGGNNISDIRPLANLVELRDLHLTDNKVSDVSPLSGLVMLRKLVVANNVIEDLTPLVNLTNLVELDIQRNPPTDYSALMGIPYLIYDEYCEVEPFPVWERIANRDYPSIAMPFGGDPEWHKILDRPDLTPVERIALHDLWLMGGLFNMTTKETPMGLKLVGDMSESIRLRDQYLAINPNLIFIKAVGIRELPLHYLPPDSPSWVRDENGNIAESQEGMGFYDFTDPEVLDDILAEVRAIEQCGLFDGVFFDHWNDNQTALAGWRPLEEEQRARATLMQFIRTELRPDFLVYVNGGGGIVGPLTGPMVNGSFMETGTPGDAQPERLPSILEHLENLLNWSESQMRRPLINTLEGWGSRNNPLPLDGPINTRWMRVITTLSLTHSDGYALFAQPGHEHYWYDFWDADLGRPVGEKGKLYQETDGLYIREFTNGWAAYNNSGAEQTIRLPEDAVGVASRLEGMSHTLPDLDGEMYLRVKPPNPADVNGDGVVNILDLTLVARAFGKDGLEGDVNGDGVVNVFDLVFVAGEIQ